MSKIPVIGTTGNVGRPLIKDLIARGEAVKAASRSGKPVEGAEGVAFDLTGPEPLSYAEAAETLSAVLGKTITYQHMEPDAFISMLAGAGAPQDDAAFVTSLFHPVRQGWSAGVTDHMKQLTGRATDALRDYAEYNKAALLA